MKKILLVTSLCVFATFSFAQKKVVKEAKSRMDKTAEAREIIKSALTNEETANDPEAWKVAGDIEYKAFEKEYDAEATKEMMKTQGGNKDLMFEGLYNMVDLYKKADELGQRPDPKKGKVNNKVRKDIVKNFKIAHRFYVDGGSYYSGKGVDSANSGNREEANKNFSKAADFFEMYCDIPSLPMFEGEKEPLIPADTIYLAMKYWATVSALQAQDSKRAERLLKELIATPYQANTTYEESAPYELLAVEYEKAGDTINYVNILKQGSDKFPKNQYFTPNLINVYIVQEKTDEAINYLDQAIANDPTRGCDLYSVKGGLLAKGEKYDESIVAYKKALESDENCERALGGLGVVYEIQASNLKAESAQTADKQKQKEMDEKAKEFYLSALPLVQKYVASLKGRDADSMELRHGLYRLYSLYYELGSIGMGYNQERQSVEKELDDLDKKLGLGQ